MNHKGTWKLCDLIKINHHLAVALLEIMSRAQNKIHFTSLYKIYGSLQ
jgi:hypothetical protein